MCVSYLTNGAVSLSQGFTLTLTEIPAVGLYAAQRTLTGNSATT